MQISRRADYGVRVILDLANLPGDLRASTEDISARQRIPTPFLAKIISQLSLAGLVTTHRGAGGGVALAKPASEISLLHVIEALEGPLRLNRCVIQPDACPRNEFCPVHLVWAQAQADLSRLLRGTTFDRLVDSRPLADRQEGVEQGELGSGPPPVHATSAARERDDPSSLRER